jgi:hypothetical protein
MAKFDASKWFILLGVILLFAGIVFIGISWFTGQSIWGFLLGSIFGFGTLTIGGLLIVGGIYLGYIMQKSGIGMGGVFTKKKISFKRFFIALGIALVSDALDLTQVLSLPLIGDPLDALTTLLTTFILRKPTALIGAVELLPTVVLDELPIHTLAVILTFLTDRLTGG